MKTPKYSTLWLTKESPYLKNKTFNCLKVLLTCPYVIEYVLLNICIRPDQCYENEFGAV